MVKRALLYMLRLIKSLRLRFKRYWHQNWWHKVITILIVLIALTLGSMYAIAQYYIRTEASKPLQLGVSFVPDYAQSLGVSPEANMDALLNIGVREFRLVSYWSDGEPSPGQYNFSQLDWEFQKAEAKHAKIILTLGLRQPGWPECHMPTWADSEPESQWQPELEAYMKAVIERYKNSPSLQSYQLENEYFLKGFGFCTNFDRNRLISEYNLVKSLDPNHPIIIARSNNSIGLPIGLPQPTDEFSDSIYLRVWDSTFTHRYLQYPFPAWYYAFIAEIQRIVTHKDMMIGEMQAEAWAPNGKQLTQISLKEQNKSLNAARLKSNIKFGEATGMRQINLWGAEYWYYRMEVLHDPSLWNVAKQEFAHQ